MNVHVQVQSPMISPLLALEIEALSMCLGGPVVTAGHADYDALRGIACSSWDRCPLLLARVADAADVADVVDFARRNQIELAVRSGSFTVGGSIEGGVVVDLSDLNSLEIDLAAMTVWAGSGLTAPEVARALDKHGVTVPFGDAGSLGIAEMTLGGGAGYLTRKFGLTIDALIGAEVVTASGSILTVSQNSYPDLFWALRGGGNSFGIVTKFCYRLGPLPEFSGGALVLPATAEVLSGFVAAAQAAPDELTAVLLAMPAPPLPFLPPEVAGSTVLMGVIAYAGPEENADRAMAPFRALASPIADTMQPGPFNMMYMPDVSAVKPAHAVRTVHKDGLDTIQAAEIIRRLELADAPMRMVQIRVLGGAVARVSRATTAYMHRDAGLAIEFLAMEGSEEAMARHDRWAGDFVAALEGVGHDGPHVNFLAAQGQEMIHLSPPDPTSRRLQQIKQIYDPTNLFRRHPPVA